MAKRNPTLCPNKKPCFAKVKGRCVVLSQTYLSGECPFYKTPEKFEDDRIKAEIRKNQR